MKVTYYKKKVVSA